MKLAPLLARFLYSNKRLDLPGIGTFLLDPAENIDEDYIKAGKPIPADLISFENNPSLKESPDLIQFISTETGKIKALAAADLGSHLSLMQQFLNIGKSFLVEGIGSLAKIKSGEYVFTPGETLPERIKESSSRSTAETSPNEESLADYKSIFYKPGKKNISLRKPTLIFLIMAGIALAIWGGYKVYKITTGNNKSADNDKKEQVVPATDTTVTQKDSVSSPAQHTAVTIPRGTYKFILEVANPKRAFERFGKLKTFQWNVQMETKDSVSYKLFMLLTALPADTSRIIDSLSMLNGRKVYIEQ